MKHLFTTAITGINTPRFPALLEACKTNDAQYLVNVSDQLQIPFLQSVMHNRILHTEHNKPSVLHLQSCHSLSFLPIPIVRITPTV